MGSTASGGRPAPDALLLDIASYVHDSRIESAQAYRIARYCTFDALGCALDALRYPECLKLLGPIVPGAVLPGGARVPGTQFELDPVTAAFNLSTMIRWLDFNDAFTAAEGTHPSDNLGGILATADYLSRQRRAAAQPALQMRDVLTALIQAYEIQGVLAMENSFTRIGLDHTGLLRVASTAVITRMLGATLEEIVNAVSNAFADAVPTKIYRQGANTGSRKNWAAGDATSRGVRLGLMAIAGEMGYPGVLTTPTFGFFEAVFRGKPLTLARPFGSYVLENVMFKFVAAGMHGQTAAECALRLRPRIADALDAIESITIRSHEKLIGIMDKSGPLHNASDRDHCVQYVVAIALLHGRVEGTDFDDDVATDPRIDKLRAKMKVVEEPRYTRDFFDHAKRSSANAIEVTFSDGRPAERVEVEYPIGHPRRRTEGLAMVEKKFRAHLARRFPAKRQARILALCLDQERFEQTAVDEFVSLFVI